MTTAEKRVIGTKITDFSTTGVNKDTGLYETKPYKPKNDSFSYKPKTYGNVREYNPKPYKPRSDVTYRGTVDYKPRELSAYYEYNPDYNGEEKPKPPRPPPKPQTPVVRKISPSPSSRPTTSKSEIQWPSNLNALGSVKRQFKIFTKYNKSSVHPMTSMNVPPSRERKGSASRRSLSRRSQRTEAF